MQDATSGIFYEVKMSEEEGRLTKLPLYAYASIVDQIVSHSKVIIDYDVITTVVRNDHFSQTGTHTRARARARKFQLFLLMIFLTI